MKFLTDEQKNKVPDLYSQEDKEDPFVYLKLRVETNYWLILELDKVKNIGFGWCCLNGDLEMAELGYVSIKVIEGLRYPVDVEEMKKPLSQVKKEVEEKISSFFSS